MHRTIVTIAVAGASLLLASTAQAFVTGTHGGSGAYTNQGGGSGLNCCSGGQEWGGGESSWPALTNQGGFSSGTGRGQDAPHGSPEQDSSDR
jgi:hypothetical protein